MGAQVASAVSVGRLVKLDWKLSVATESSSCSSLMSPFVVLLLTVSDSDGNLRSVPVEMTLAEFDQFATSIDEVASVLETV